MHYSKYTNGLVGYDQSNTFYSQRTTTTENERSIHSNDVKNVTSCREGCKDMLHNESEVAGVRYELDPSRSACYVPPQPNPNGLLPAVYIPGSTVFIAYLFLRMLLNFRILRGSNRSKG